MRTAISLNGIEHPCFVVGSGSPRVSIIGGVHGCEYSSIQAVTRLMRELETEELNGTVTGVPVVSMQSFTERSPFVVPADGKNLNRAFPGDPDGTYTQRLAHDIYTKLIAPADAVIDLHGGDLVEALEPFAIYSNAASRDLALAFNLPYVVAGSDLEGMTCGSAKVGVIAEAGGIGQLEEHAVDLLARGARNALKHLGVVHGVPEPSRSQTVGRFVWLYSEPGGFWVAGVKTGDDVNRGDVVGEIRDLHGETLQQVRADDDGVVLFLTTSAAVKADGLLMGLGCD